MDLVIEILSYLAWFAMLILINGALYFFVVIMSITIIITAITIARQLLENLKNSRFFKGFKAFFNIGK